MQSCMILPSGMVKLPTTGCEKPRKTWSYTVQESAGQYSSATGRGILNLTTELMLGFAPLGPGCVLMFYICPDSFGSVKLLIMKLTKAFWIGSRPIDSSSRSPRQLMKTS